MAVVASALSLVLVSACVVPLEREVDLSAMALRDSGGDGLVFAGGVHAGAGLGCRSARWSGMMRAGVVGAWDTSAARPLLSLRFGPGVHYQMGTLLATSTLTGGPILNRGGGGGGGELTLGLGVRLGPTSAPDGSLRSRWLVLEGVADVRGVEVDDATDGLLFGVRIRYLRRVEPPCYRPEPPPMPAPGDSESRP